VWNVVNGHGSHFITSTKQNEKKNVLLKQKKARELRTRWAIFRHAATCVTAVSRLEWEKEMVVLEDVLGNPFVCKDAGTLYWITLVAVKTDGARVVLIVSTPDVFGKTRNRLRNWLCNWLREWLREWLHDCHTKTT
jgi:hypothetical protein